jgi:S-adenosylhomocysteine hydrolase
MKKKEINEIMAHVAALSDEKLEEEYYTAVDNCLGSQVDTMIERGYDSVDIIEREKHEKYLSSSVFFLRSFARTFFLSNSIDFLKNLTCV